MIMRAITADVCTIDNVGQPASYGLLSVYKKDNLKYNYSVTDIGGELVLVSSPDFDTINFPKYVVETCAPSSKNAREFTLIYPNGWSKPSSDIYYINYDSDNGVYYYVQDNPTTHSADRVNCAIPYLYIAQPSITNYKHCTIRSASNEGKVLAMLQGGYVQVYVKPCGSKGATQEIIRSEVNVEISCEDINGNMGTPTVINSDSTYKVIDPDSYDLSPLDSLQYDPDTGIIRFFSYSSDNGELIYINDKQYTIELMRKRYYQEGSIVFNDSQFAYTNGDEIQVSDGWEITEGPEYDEEDKTLSLSFRSTEDKPVGNIAKLKFTTNHSSRLAFSQSEYEIVAKDSETDLGESNLIFNTVTDTITFSGFINKDKVVKNVVVNNTHAWNEKPAYIGAINGIPLSDAATVNIINRVTDTSYRGNLAVEYVSPKNDNDLFIRTQVYEHQHKGGLATCYPPVATTITRKMSISKLSCLDLTSYNTLPSGLYMYAKLQDNNYYCHSSIAPYITGYDRAGNNVTIARSTFENVFTIVIQVSDGSKVNPVTFNVIVTFNRAIMIYYKWSNGEYNYAKHADSNAKTFGSTEYSVQSKHPSITVEQNQFKLNSEGTLELIVKDRGNSEISYSGSYKLSEKYPSSGTVPLSNYLVQV